MANPQIENGYTRIANELIEALAITDLNGTQRRIIDVVLRQTYGYQRKEHDLSITFIANATNIHKKQIQRELATLIERKIITVVSEATFNKSRILTFNKSYKEWLNSSEVSNKLPPNKIDTHTGSELVPGTGSELATQIKKKENIKQRDFESVFNFYLTLNLKKHRAYTNDMKKAINKAVKDNKYSTEYCKTLLERHKQVVDITKQHEFPVRVRGFAEFFGQKVYGATHLICSEYEEGGKYYEQYLKEQPKVEVDIRVGVPPSESVLGEREEEWDLSAW